MRSVATQPHIMVERYGKAPLGSGESTRATSNGVNFCDMSVSVSRLCAVNLARGHIHMFGRADNCRIDAVAIGRDPLAGPGAARRPGGKPGGGRESTEVGANSRDALSDRGRGDGVIPLERTLPVSVPPPGGRAPLSESSPPWADGSWFS